MKKKLAIDCRYLGCSGIGRFLEGILESFNFELFDVYLIGKENLISKYKNCNYIYDDTNPFSAKDLFKSNNANAVNECDIFFSPNFILPYWVKIKSFTVLHDIIFLDMPDVNKNFIEKNIKKHLIKRSLKKSTKQFTVSKFSKNRIIHYFPKFENKIIYAYQGVASQFNNYVFDGKKENYIVYVGNIKKHKGLKTLLQAYNNFNCNTKLKIIGDSKNFKNGDDEVLKLIKNSNIEFSGRVDDNQLLDIIAHAKYLIQPSLYEGFGLPPLEALYLGTQPIVSDIEVFKEVYSDLPVRFFKVNDSESLKNEILKDPDIININKEECNKKFSYKNYAKIITKELLK